MIYIKLAINKRKILTIQWTNYILEYQFIIVITDSIFILYFRKKLRTEIRSQYPSLTEEDAFKLVPHKEEMSATKICTSGEDNVLVYSVGKKPIFYEIFKSLYPTGINSFLSSINYNHLKLFDCCIIMICYLYMHYLSSFIKLDLSIFLAYL